MQQSDGHRRKDALRVAMKAFLKDLWTEWDNLGGVLTLFSQRPLKSAAVERALDVILDHLHEMDDDNRQAAIERILGPFDFVAAPKLAAPEPSDPEPADANALLVDYDELEWDTHEWDGRIVSRGELVARLVADAHYWIDLTDDDDESKGYSATFMPEDCNDGGTPETLGENLSLEAAQELAERHFARAEANEKRKRSRKEAKPAPKRKRKPKGAAR
jgi:hypothetical protein